MENLQRILVVILILLLLAIAAVGQGQVVRVASYNIQFVSTGVTAQGRA